MPALTPEQLAALANTGASTGEIELALGHKLTETEREIVTRSRLVKKLRFAERKKNVGDRLTSAQKTRAFRARDRLVEYADPQDAKRRARLEKKPEEWLRWYLADRFPLPFGEVHKKLIESAIRSIVTGTAITAAAPRGFGKTSILWGVALYAVLTGLCRFPFVLGWKANAGAELLDQWLSVLSESDRLRADYPCQCAPFEESVQSTRLKGLLRTVEPETLIGCDVRKGRNVIVIPDVNEPGTGVKRLGCVLASGSMNGSIKGLNIALVTGESLRPDIALLDDPQDEETAESEEQVKKVLKKIDYGVRSLSGPKRRLTVMAAVTCVAINDVSDHLLARPGTEAIRIGQITSWPVGWSDTDSKTRAAWDAWNVIRIAGLERLDGGKAARADYRANKDVYTAGMAVSWLHRFHAGDGVRTGDPDAFFAAMWDFYELGELAFMAERQNQPLKQGVDVFSLTAKTVVSRTTDRAPGDVPTWAEVITAGTDINPSYALSSAVTGFGKDLTSAVLWYGRFTDPPLPTNDQMSQTQREAAVYGALWKHGGQLLAMPSRSRCWVIDGGGAQSSVAKRFFADWNRAHPEMPVIVSYGRSGKSARVSAKNETIRRRGPDMSWILCRDRDAQFGWTEWLLWNSDYWREIMQRAWTCEPGAPGGITLPTGHHRDFADEICRERLRAKGLVGERMFWDYVKSPGMNDLSDALNMCYVGASVMGVGTGGAIVRHQTKSRPRGGVEVIRL